MLAESHSTNTLQFLNFGAREIGYSTGKYVSFSVKKEMQIDSHA